MPAEATISTISEELFVGWVRSSLGVTVGLNEILKQLRKAKEITPKRLGYMTVTDVLKVLLVLLVLLGGGPVKQAATTLHWAAHLQPFEFEHSRYATAAHTAPEDVMVHQAIPNQHTCFGNAFAWATRPLPV